jgi:hypothetical protein
VIRSHAALEVGRRETRLILRVGRLGLDRFLQRADRAVKITDGRIRHTHRALRGRSVDAFQLLYDTCENFFMAARRAAKESSARAGRAKVLLNLCERDHHHHWLGRTLVESGTCVEALRVV